MKNAMYEGKKFYEVVNGQLVGPLDNIYYLSDSGKAINKGYKYCQVINGKPVQVFKEHEIVVKNG